MLQSKKKIEGDKQFERASVPKEVEGILRVQIIMLTKPITSKVLMSMLVKLKKLSITKPKIPKMKTPKIMLIVQATLNQKNNKPEIMFT